jgi:2-aminoethylphosphonate-pyruvate transaminase
VLIDGMRALGFETLARQQSAGADHRHVPHAGRSGVPFQAFYDALKERGYVIYPGKLTVADSFRIGCIGRLYPEHMRGALAAIRDILDEMGVKSLKAAA